MFYRNQLNMLNIVNNTFVKVILIFTIVWTFFDVIMHLLLSVLHAIGMVLHYAFEFFEHGLEQAIEHAFHTSPRAAEIITFYVLAAIVGVIAYQIIRRLPKWCVSCQQRLHSFLQQEIKKAKEFWESQSLVLKAKWYGFVVTGSFVLYFFML